MKSISKDERDTLVAQNSNFSKVYATIEGCSVADGSVGGGLFLRNVLEVFKYYQFVLSHKWSDMIVKG